MSDTVKPYLLRTSFGFGLDKNSFIPKQLVLITTAVPYDASPKMHRSKIVKAPTIIQSLVRHLQQSLPLKNAQKIKSEINAKGKKIKHIAIMNPILNLGFWSLI